ncbi:hypothetical protein IE53DRAFT_383762 [Violaceomyces palustris]|uniref:Uncharacterized protein n=1 Tax=Violaceomyces palustris TaxID=1673888 RepID=A0ACD0P6H6_9BASI|nr:hypothetical protein IE53DRAFT_383762 [Violaceomyces palustris]
MTSLYHSNDLSSTRNYTGVGSMNRDSDSHSSSSSEGPSTPPNRTIRVDPLSAIGKNLLSQQDLPVVEITQENNDFAYRVQNGGNQLQQHQQLEQEAELYQALSQSLSKMNMVNQPPQSSALERIHRELSAQSAWKGKSTVDSTPCFSSSASEIGEITPASAASPIPEIVFEGPVAALTQKDIVFRSSMIPDSSLQERNVRDVLVERFPTLCDPPAKMFGEDGKPLPPTKKQEITAEEREARKRALMVTYKSKQVCSMIKATVIMESRTSNWKRIGPSSSNATASCSSSPIYSSLPEVPSPWTVEITHENLDLSAMPTKAKKVFELAGTRCEAACPKCSGRGLDTCTTCKGEAADECFWCSGTGKEKGRGTCHRCSGLGKLACKKCQGTLLSPCLPCEGNGSGIYANMVTVKMKKVSLPPVPVSWIVSSARPHLGTVKSAATRRVWELIQRMNRQSNTTTTQSSYVPVSAECSWEISTNHLVEVDVPLQARLSSKKNQLKPLGLHRKIPTQKRFFTLPTDPDLKPDEISPSEFAAFESKLREESRYGHSEPVTPAEFPPTRQPLASQSSCIF